MTRKPQDYVTEVDPALKSARDEPVQVLRSPAARPEEKAS